MTTSTPGSSHFVRWPRGVVRSWVTAIKGTPTVAGVYEPVATAFIFGVPVRTETTTVTVTGGAGGCPYEDCQCSGRGFASSSCGRHLGR